MKKLTRLYKLAMQNQTPFLAYDGEQLRENLAQLASLSARYPVHFLMAVKSFPHPEMLGPAQEYGLSFDVSNLAEASLVAANAKTLWMTDPSGLWDLERKLDWAQSFPQSILTLDQKSDWEELSRRKSKIAVALRLSTDFLVTKSRFGLSLGEAQEWTGQISSMGLNWTGIHFHFGSENNTIEQYLTMAQQAVSLAKISKLPLPRLNLGGGLHGLGRAKLEEMIDQVCQYLSQHSPQTQVYFEPGRWLSENAGYAVGRVLKKTSKGKHQELILDLSAVCHLNWERPQLLQTTTTRSDQEKISFYGPSCYEKDLIGDFLASESGLPHWELGDLVFFSNISGYAHALNRSFNGISAASTFFF